MNDSRCVYFVDALVCKDANLRIIIILAVLRCSRWRDAHVAAQQITTCIIYAQFCNLRMVLQESADSVAF